MKRDTRDLIALGAIGGALFLLAKSGGARAKSIPPPSGPVGPKPQPEGPPGPPAPPSPVGPVPPVGPSQPSPDDQPLGPVPIIGGRVRMVSGARYRAEITLSAGKALFATEGAVAAELTKHGFSGVVVRSLGGGRYQGAGTWAQPSTTARLPEQISKVERLK